MLDLNLNVALSDSGDMVTEEILPLSGIQMDSSGSFNSSVVNADASTNSCDEDSCSYGDEFAYNFSILKKNALDNGTSSKAVELPEDDGENGGSPTIQVFPIAGPRHVNATELGIWKGSPSSFSNKGWLDFLIKEVVYEGELEQRIIPQLQ